MEEEAPPPEDPAVSDGQILDDLTNLQNAAPGLEGESDLQGPIDSSAGTETPPENPSQQDANSLATQANAGATTGDDDPDAGATEETQAAAGGVGVTSPGTGAATPPPSSPGDSDTETSGASTGSAAGTSSDPAGNAADDPAATDASSSSTPGGTTTATGAATTSTGSTTPPSSGTGSSTEGASDPAGDDATAPAGDDANANTEQPGTPAAGTSEPTSTGTGSSTEGSSEPIPDSAATPPPPPPIGGAAEAGVGSSSGTVSEAPSLSVAKTSVVAGADGQPKTIVSTAGDQVTFTVSVTNTGNTVLSDITVSDPLSASGTVISGVSLAPGETGTYSFVYTATEQDIATAGGGDNLLDSTVSVVSDQTTVVTANAGATINSAPVAASGSQTTAENSVLESNVPAASDVDGTIASYALVEGVIQGSLTFNSDGSYSFNPGSDFDDLDEGVSREVSFTYTATDEDGATSEPQTVTITVTGTNDVATLSSATETLTETDGVLSTSGKLSLTDADTTDATVVAQPNTAGTYGTFSIDAAGAWSYTTSDAVNQLDAGQRVTETFNVTTSDGGTATVTVNIDGTNDVATLSSATETLTETDGVLSTSGKLSLTDADTTDATVVAQPNTAGTYGTFSIDAAGAWSYTTSDAVNQLDAGQRVTETFNVTTSDGGTATVTVNIDGTNDVATLSSATETLTETDGVLSTSGKLSLTDADTTDATVVAQPNTAGTYGTFSIDAAGAWSYTTSDAVNQLDAGQRVTETFNVTTSDGGTATVTVNIDGTNDVATLSSATETLTETDGVLSTSGKLSLTDADTTDATVVAQPNTAGTYGTFSIDAAGAWSYTTSDAVNQLDAGQRVTETFNVTTSDGGTATVTVNIDGTNDVATLSSATETLTETDGVLSTSGKLSLTDADTTDATVVAQPNTAGTYGTFSIDAAGAWSYTTSDAVNQLDAGQRVTETFNVTTSDGGTATVTVNIDGTNDVATLSSATETLTETDGVLSTSGKLSLTDADTTDATVVAQPNTAGTYGTFSIDAAGAWSYTTSDAVNQLDAGQRVTETFNVTTSDGGTATVTVNIDGTNDVATLSSATETLTETDGVLSTSGKLSLTDADTTDATVVAQPNTAGTYGTFSIDAAGAWSYTTSDAVNQLDAGQRVTETFNVTTSDGGTATVTVNIDGTNDVATLSSATETLTETDGVLSTSGKLSLTDADTTDATVVAQPNTAGTYGTFSIDAAGAWSYTTSDAVNQLDAGQRVTETFNVTTSDGGTATVTVNIDGTNDVATLSSATETLTETDGVLSTSGKLSLTDADTTDATVVAQPNTAGTYGTFSIDAAGAWSYTTSDAVNQLDAGQRVTETFNVTTSDGGTATVTVNIDGTNDVATLSSATETLTETDGVLSTSGKLSLTDADTTDATVVAQPNTAGTYGTFSIDAAGAWSYTTSDAVNQLDAGQRVTETFNVTTSDGGTATVTVNIDGTNDVATLSSATETLTETDGVLSTSGKLSLTDADTTDATVVAQPNTAGTYGTFSIDAAGAWSYTTSDAVNQLDAGQRVTETFNVTTSDGGTATVTVNIDGTNDVATLSSATETLTETDGVLSTSGKLSLTDADTTDATVVAQPNTAGTYGTFSIDAAGAWSYTTSDAVNQLDAGQRVTETFNVTTSDGGTATVTVNIDGTNDVATLSSATETLTETDGVLSTSGKLSLTDADTTDATVVAQPNTAGTYGTFSIDAAGAWSYTTSDAVNQLDAGQRVTETFNVTTSDGGTATVTVNIDGTNDVATLSSATETLTETDGVLSTSGKLSLTDADTTDATVVAPAEHSWNLWHVLDRCCGCLELYDQRCGQPA